jgi:hypothetical protein
MFESITGWRYVDYSTPGWVTARWGLFLPLAFLLSGLSTVLVGLLLEIPKLVFWDIKGLPKELTYSISYFVSGYVFMLVGVKLAPKAKRIITFILLGVSIVCILFAINAAITVMKAFNIDKTYTLYGHITSLIGNGVAFAKIAQQNYFTPTVSTSAPAPE